MAMNATAALTKTNVAVSVKIDASIGPKAADRSGA
jgi:hypothetical protein